MRSLSLLAFPVLLVACGQNPEEACEDYLAAAFSCIEEAYPTDSETYKSSYEGACTGYSGLKGSAAKEATDLLNCYTEIYANADCSTGEGFAEIDILTCAGA